MRPNDRETQSQKRRIDDAIIDGIEKEIDDCHQLSSIHRAKEIVFFTALYLAGASWVNIAPQHTSHQLIGIIIMGVAMNSLGILIHEGLHGLLSKNPSINRFLSFLCGLPLLISACAYRTTHSDHHFEFGRKRDYGTYRQHLDNKYFVWFAYYAQLLFGSILYILLIPLLAWKGAPPRTRTSIALEYLVIGCTVASAIHFLTAHSLLVFWIYPAIVMNLLTNIRGLSSHALGNLDDIYLSSRTVKCSRIVEVLFLNENYHLEHHLFPQVPSYHLKRIHQLVWNRLPRALHSRSYLSFLTSFFKASLILDLRPCGVVHPNRALSAKL